jgi:hypothetical protein
MAGRNRHRNDACYPTILSNPLNPGQKKEALWLRFYHLLLLHWLV